MMSLWLSIPVMSLAANLAMSWGVRNVLGGNTIPGFELMGSGTGLLRYMSLSHHVYACYSEIAPSLMARYPKA